jgi:hypothetical protein
LSAATENDEFVRETALSALFEGCAEADDFGFLEPEFDDEFDEEFENPANPATSTRRMARFSMRDRWLMRTQSI